jgi:phosphoribosylanthranilate isomerase
MRAKAKRSIHVAGVIDLAEAKLLIDCGIRYLGFPLVLDHHREDLTTDAAAAIISELGDHATFFLITYLNRAPAIVELCHALSVEMVQLHGETSLEQIQRLRRKAPNLRIIKSLIVRGSNTRTLIDEVQRYGPSVDSFIADTFDPVTGASGATGRVHDWENEIRLGARKTEARFCPGELEHLFDTPAKLPQHIDQLHGASNVGLAVIAEGLRDSPDHAVLATSLEARREPC